MTVLPLILMMTLSLAIVGLAKRRTVLEARPNGTLLYGSVQAALVLACVIMLCWQVFTMGFQMGGDIARRDARAEARAAAS